MLPTASSRLTALNWMMLVTIMLPDGVKSGPPMISVALSAEPDGRQFAETTSKVCGFESRPGHSRASWPFFRRSRQGTTWRTTWFQGSLTTYGAVREHRESNGGDDVGDGGIPERRSIPPLPARVTDPGRRGGRAKLQRTDPQFPVSPTRSFPSGVTAAPSWARNLAEAPAPSAKPNRPGMPAIVITVCGALAAIRRMAAFPASTTRTSPDLVTATALGYRKRAWPSSAASAPPVAVAGDAAVTTLFTRSIRRIPRVHLVGDDERSVRCKRERGGPAEPRALEWSVSDPSGTAAHRGDLVWTPGIDSPDAVVVRVGDVDAPAPSWRRPAGCGTSRRSPALS